MTRVRGVGRGNSLFVFEKRDLEIYEWSFTEVQHLPDIYRALKAFWLEFDGRDSGRYHIICMDA